MKIPKHHARYARAWSLYSEDLPEETKQILEREMDAAQTAFTFEEFQDFKKTLPGFMDYWRRLAEMLR